MARLTCCLGIVEIADRTHGVAGGVKDIQNLIICAGEAVVGFSAKARFAICVAALTLLRGVVGVMGRFACEYAAGPILNVWQFTSKALRNLILAFFALRGALNTGFGCRVREVSIPAARFAALLLQVKAFPTGKAGGCVAVHAGCASNGAGQTGVVGVVLVLSSATVESASTCCKEEPLHAFCASCGSGTSLTVLVAAFALAINEKFVVLAQFAVFGRHRARLAALIAVKASTI